MSFVFTDVHACAYVRMWVCTRECGCLRSPEAPDPPELELQTVASCCRWLLEEQQVLLTGEPSLQPLTLKNSKGY